MDNRIVKTTKFNTGFAGEVFLEEMQDGRQHIRKTYINSKSLTNADEIGKEWDALVFLHNAGYAVPEPYKKDQHNIIMQYVDSGNFWETYQAVGTTAQYELMDKFIKLLYDLHIITPNTPPSSGFIKNELMEIETIITGKGLDCYREILGKLEALSTEIKESPPCFIHRDYHPWNVLLDKNRKLYAIDLLLKQGDYRFDVGWTYMIMYRTGFEDFAQEFLEGYYKLKSEVCCNMEYFKQLANLRWIVNVWSENPSPFFRAMMDKGEQFIVDFLSC
jgi:aminoglycoside phosphotransferase (APT) family kinase protein